MGLWEEGHRYKIFTKDDRVFTAFFEGREDGLLVIIDKNGVKRALDPEDVKEVREMGEDYGDRIHSE